MRLTSAPEGRGALPPAVVLDWPIGGGTGWGTFGLNLALQLVRDGRCQPALLMPPSPDLHPLHRHLLAPSLAQQRQLQEALERAPGNAAETEYPVLRALGNGLAEHPASGLIRSERNVALVFFEDTRLPPEALRRAAEYERVVAGSEWNAAVLRAAGLDNVCAVQQGVDPTLFHPAPRAGLFRDRFVVFSGGKLEYRKGQDLVVAAFRRFRQRHPEALLVTAWHNPWPRTLAGLDSAGYVRGVPGVDAYGRLAVGAWLRANGVPEDAFVDLGPLPNAMMAPAIREADVALFPNRCEGGTNLVAMEAMACGVPCILADNTGQRDLVRPDACYPLGRQGPIRGGSPLFAGYEGWGESDLDEIVDRLEEVWRDGEHARKVGLTGARLMRQEWTWERQTARLLDLLAAGREAAAPDLARAG